MEFKDGLIKLDKVLNELDKFLLRFLKVLEKHTSYVVVSGYVAILLGRSRATEDIDVMVPDLDRETFGALFADLADAGFTCLNSDDVDELFSMLEDFHGIRFYEAAPIPNIELKFAKGTLGRETLKSHVKVVLGEDTILISPIELQIPYKEIILGTEKDREDARHLEIVLGENLDKERLAKYRRLISEKKDEILR